MANHTIIGVAGYHPFNVHTMSAAGASSSYVPNQGNIVTDVVQGVAGAVINTILSPIPTGNVGGIDAGGVNGSCLDDRCAPGYRWSAKSGCCVKVRRRRKRMLTCSDKSDIAFLTATLGKGDMAKSAIGSLLSRSCS